MTQPRDSNPNPQGHALTERSSSDSNASSSTTSHDDPHGPPPQTSPSSSVRWTDLPKKQQLAIITLARMSEPLVQTSLQSYMFYQLKWFDPSLSDATIAAQAGVLHASFTAAQFLTAMLWGRVADSPLAGRKTVLLIGLLGTSVSCLGFGFSSSFWQALLFRTLGGITNGNIGVMRTMISEIVREKRFQARAFLLLPMTFNIGVIVGPILGGVLSDPAGSYPRWFGGVGFFVRFPYALPNLLSFLFLAAAALAVWLGLEETLDALRDDAPDLGSRIGHRLAAWHRKRFGVAGPNGNDGGGGDSDGRLYSYSSVPTSDIEISGPSPRKPKTSTRRYTQRLPFRRIFTPNVRLTLFAQFFLTFHVGTFNSLWFVFLSTPVHDPSTSPHPTRLPFLFTGGLGLQPRLVGTAMAILGAIGISMQLLLYPSLSARLGTVRSWRLFLLCFPLVYFLVPYLAVVPSASPPPAAKSGPAIWLAIFAVLLIQVTGRTFTLPSQAIIVNNCSPHPSVLGTVHGIGQTVSSAGRTIGPMAGGLVYGFGLSHGAVGLVWWILSGVAVCACFTSLLVREGDGHEIWLEGDAKEEDAN